MFSGETTKELQKIIYCQNEKICKLSKKLEEFDSVVSERNDLREIYKKFEQNNEISDNGHRKLFSKLLSMFKIETEKLKEATNAEYRWEVKYGKLEDVKYCLNHKLEILKCNENELQSKLADLETNLKYVQNELCTTKLKLEEQNNTVKTLETDFKCKKQELCEVSRKHNECKTVRDKLHETNEMLSIDLKSTKKCLCDTKLTIKHMEETFMLERENLSNELNISYKKFNELEIRYSEAMCELNDQRFNIKKFCNQIIASNKVNAKNHLEMKSLLHKLQREICSKNNDLCCLKNKVNELQQDNESKCMEINTLKNKLLEKESQLKQVCLLSEKIELLEKKIKAFCCPKKKPETNTCLKKKTKANTSCKRNNSMIDIICCDAFNNAKVVIQKYPTKSNSPNYNICKTELKHLKCELDDLQ